MGYSEDLFTNKQIEDEFLCQICHDVIQDPTSLRPCDHVFCVNCIENWRNKCLENKRPFICPTDRQAIKKTKKPQRYYTNLLNKLELRCPFNGNGCVQVMQLGNLPDHLLKCKFNPENQKECEGRCGAVLTQYVRNSGTHNCVNYLMEQWQVTKDELKVAKDEVESTKEHLKESEENSKENQQTLVELRAKLLKVQEKQKSAQESEMKLQDTRKELKLAEVKLLAAAGELHSMEDNFEAMKEELKSTVLQLCESKEKLASKEAELQETNSKLQYSDEMLQKARDAVQSAKEGEEHLIKSLDIGSADQDQESQSSAGGGSSPPAKKPRFNPHNPNPSSSSSDSFEEFEFENEAAFHTRNEKLAREWGEDATNTCFVCGVTELNKRGAEQSSSSGLPLPPPSAYFHTYYGEKSFNRHFKSFHMKYPDHQCNICGLSAESDESLKAHQAKMKNGKILNRNQPMYRKHREHNDIETEKRRLKRRNGRP